jgi:hypothetical protein
VQPNLAAAGFRVADRGQVDHVTWIDFERSAPANSDALPEGQSLLLYHLGGHEHVGARFSRYDLVGSAQGARGTSTVWPYEPRTLTTPAGQPLALALVDWVRGRLDPRPR